MIRVLLVLAGLCAGLLTIAANSAQASSTQTLGIVFHRSHAATVELPHYRTATPLTVNVRGGRSMKLDRVTLTAHGPDGSAVTTPLSRTDNGSFSGNIRLTSPGTWTLALSTQLGSALASVPLDVVGDDGAQWAGTLAFCLSALLIVAGVLIIARPAGRALGFAAARSEG